MEERDLIYDERQPPPRQGSTGLPKGAPKWAVLLMSLFLVAFALELMLIAALAWYRISYGLYNTDPELFVMALNEFGSSFFGGTILGAGGAVAAMRLLPSVLSKLEQPR